MPTTNVTLTAAANRRNLSEAGYRLILACFGALVTTVFGFIILPLRERSRFGEVPLTSDFHALFRLTHA